MSYSFVLQALGLAFSLILMFVFASVAINVLPVAGLVHSVITNESLAQDKLRRCIRLRKTDSTLTRRLASGKEDRVLLKFLVDQS